MTILRHRPSRQRRSDAAFDAETDRPPMISAAATAVKRHGIDTPETLDAIIAEARRQQLLRDWYGYHDTSPDYPPDHHRPYVPEPAGQIVLPQYREIQGRPALPAVDVRADLCTSPVFRDTLGRLLRNRRTECILCGYTVAGDSWPEQYADEHAHLRNFSPPPVPDFELRRTATAILLEQAAAAGTEATA